MKKEYMTPLSRVAETDLKLSILEGTVDVDPGQEVDDGWVKEETMPETHNVWEDEW